MDRNEVAELLIDVPKWEHAEEGSLRIRYPEDPVLPQPREDDLIAAAEEAEEEETTESLTLDKSLRPTTRPAEA